MVMELALDHRATEPAAHLLGSKVISFSSKHVSRSLFGSPEMKLASLRAT